MVLRGADDFIRPPALLESLDGCWVSIRRGTGLLTRPLSADVGFPEVLVHLGTVVGLMKFHNDFEAVEKQLNTVAPIYPETLGLFDDPKDWEPR